MIKTSALCPKELNLVIKLLVLGLLFQWNLLKREKNGILGWGEYACELPVTAR